jgi:hypothetical protein
MIMFISATNRPTNRRAARSEAARAKYAPKSGPSVEERHRQYARESLARSERARASLYPREEDDEDDY